METQQGYIMNPTKTLEYWTVENTGWSGGISWFKTGGSEANPLRFKTFDTAHEFAVRNKNKFDDPDQLWRVVYTKIERSDPNKRVTTEEYHMI
jgi:hypothetical protein